MSQVGPRFAPDVDGNRRARRRLLTAIGGALLAGAIAVVALTPDEPPAAPVPEVVEPEAAKPDDPAQAGPRDADVGAVARLRDAADRFVDARRDALEQLDIAQSQGADPRVVSAFAGLLGVPPPAPPVDGAPAQAVPDEDEPPPRPPPPPDRTADPARAL